MNKNQKYVLIGVVVVLLLQMIFFTPFVATSDGRDYHHSGNFFTPTIYEVNVPSFILYWGIIFVFGGIVFYLAKDNKENKKE